MIEKVIVAIDHTDWSVISQLANSLEGSGASVKVGMELYYSHGTKAIDFFANNNIPVFLDLKLHDIPNTVEKALTHLCSLPVFMLNVHASGGLKMLQAAHHARLKSGRKDLTLIAVTQLTSTSQEMMNNELKIMGDLQDSVSHLARLTSQSGLDGVVCSAHEVAFLKQQFGAQFKCITPGIRPQGSASHDQVRIMTPQQALDAGSDYLVIGRAITEAIDPREALENLF